MVISVNYLSIFLKYTPSSFLRADVKPVGSKITIPPPTHNTRIEVGTVKDTANMFYSTKNLMRNLCVGGYMVILFFLRRGGFYTDSYQRFLTFQCIPLGKIIQKL